MIISPYTDLEIELPEGPIGVSVSGGADSAILLYFLMKYHKHKIYITTLADRSKMKFPILIGRKMLRGKFIVDITLKNQ